MACHFFLLLMVCIPNSRQRGMLADAHSCQCRRLADDLANITFLQKIEQRRDENVLVLVKILEKTRFVFRRISWPAYGPFRLLMPFSVKGQLYCLPGPLKPAQVGRRALSVLQAASIHSQRPIEPVWHNHHLGCNCWFKPEEINLCASVKSRHKHY